MKKERIFYLDFIRAVATIGIIMTHYNALFIYNTSVPMREKAFITTTVGNVYIGEWGISLFLIISGAALMFVYEEKLDVFSFFKKRLKNLYPMFWIGYLIAFIYLFIRNQGMDWSIGRWRMIYSILGIDMYLSNFGIMNFAIVGEWFLGYILMIYLLFPILRKMVLEHPAILGLVSLGAYIISIVLFDRNILLFVRLPEFLFGMYFMKYIKRVNWKVALISIAIIIANTFIKPTFTENVQVIYIGIASFLFLVYISEYLKKDVIVKFCAVVCKYSYPCFIIHHFVIYRIAERFDLNVISRTNSYILFVCCFFMIALCSVILDKITSFVMGIWE